jgi:hypothetical protein
LRCDLRAKVGSTRSLSTCCGSILIRAARLYGANAARGKVLPDRIDRQLRPSVAVQMNSR